MTDLNYMRPRQGFLLRLVRGSVIIGAMERFTIWFYSLLRDGFFGWIFTGYFADPQSCLLPRLAQTKTAAHLKELRFGICRRMETSLIVNAVRSLMRRFLGCRLKVWGTFLLSFTFYSALKTIFVSLTDDGTETAAAILSFSTFTYAVGLAAIPLILSKKTLAEALVGSVVGRAMMKATGFREEDLAPEGRGGKFNIAFLMGLFCGALTFWVPGRLLVGPLTAEAVVLGAIAAMFGAYLILIRPELGVLALFFLTPWSPHTWPPAILVIYTFLCLLLKLFRRKRILRLEPADLIAAAFALLLFIGAFSALPDSLVPELTLFCLMAGYFLTVILLRSREWIVRCASAAVLSAALIAILGIVMQRFGLGYSSEAWLDSDMFGEIAGRAVATLDNPNMLGEYLILLLPVAAVMLVGTGEGIGRLPALFCCGAMGVCLILTQSRGAWLGLIGAVCLFLLMWHRRFFWLFAAGAAAVPMLLLNTGLTEKLARSYPIFKRLLSIGNMADSSTSYRMYIWKASLRMIRDNPLFGIGAGKGAWDSHYPLYTYMGIEDAPHSHNLFFQIWLDLGAPGIILFLLFLFLLFQAAFTLFRELSGSRPLKNPDLSPVLFESGRDTALTPLYAMKRGKSQLRLSAAGPLCGIFAVLVQGMTDYAWYNHRLFLMFWLTAGLAVCYIRDGRAQLDDGCFDNDPDASDGLFPLRPEKRNSRSKMRRKENEHE